MSEHTFILHNTNTINTIESDTADTYAITRIDQHTFKRLLYNNLHKKFCFEVTPEKIKEEFNIEIDDEDSKESKENNIIKIIPMPELTKQQVQIYLSTFIDEVDNLDKYAEYLAIISYNQVSPNKFQVKKHLEKLLEEQSSYWEDESNCGLTINDIFAKRKFNHDLITGTLTKDNDKNKSKQINNCIDKINRSDLNYLNGLTRSINTSEIISNSSSYWISKCANSTNEFCNQIYKQIPTEYLKYSFLCNMLCTRTHCHLILNNKELLIEAKPIFDKYKAVFKYFIGYAWLTFRQEEGSKKSKITESDRIVFPIEAASLLPIYPFAHDDINQNPYASISLDKKLMDLSNNCLSMQQIRTNPEKYYGVCDFATFNKRINIFVNGSNKRGIMDKIDWKHFAITGSAMTACGMKYNPLFDLYRANPNSGEISDQEYATYLFHYYNNSDIDLICNHKSIYDYLNATHEIISNLETEYNNKMKLTHVHTASIILSDELISSELEELSAILLEPDTTVSQASSSSPTNTSNNGSSKFIPVITVDYIKRNFSNEKIRGHFYAKYYLPWKTEQNEQIKNPASPHTNKVNYPVYAEYLTPIPSSEFRIYTLDYEVDAKTFTHQDYEKYYYGSMLEFGCTDPKKLVCKLSESVRFQIKSPVMNRSWEIFKSRDSSFFSTVAKFHMGFVRAIYNGNTVLCLPSFISAMMLQISTDYKYFASVRNPIEIINKYRSRGFGIILNDDEKIHFAYYNSFKPDELEHKYVNLDELEHKSANPANPANKWCDMYQVNIKNKKSIDAIFGAKGVNDVIFKPSKFFDGITDDCFKTVNFLHYDKASDAFDYMYTPETKFLFQYKCINDSGTINPLNREIIKTAFDAINNSKQNIVPLIVNQIPIPNPNPHN